MAVGTICSLTVIASFRRGFPGTDVNLIHVLVRYGEKQVLRLKIRNLLCGNRTTSLSNYELSLIVNNQSQSTCDFSRLKHRFTGRASQNLIGIKSQFSIEKLNMRAVDYKLYISANAGLASNTSPATARVLRCRFIFLL